MTYTKSNCLSQKSAHQKKTQFFVGVIPVEIGNFIKNNDGWIFLGWHLVFFFWLYSMYSKLDPKTCVHLSSILEELQCLEENMSLCPCKSSRYLGGSLYLQSLPGVGTCAYLYLKRLESEAREELPNNSSVSSCSLVWKSASCELLRPSIEGRGIDLWRRHESIWFSKFSKFSKKQLWTLNHLFIWSIGSRSTFQDENNALQRKRGGFHDIIASYHHGKRLGSGSGGAARIRTGSFFCEVCVVEM